MTEAIFEADRVGALARVEALSLKGTAAQGAEAAATLERIKVSAREQIQVLADEIAAEPPAARDARAGQNTHDLWQVVGQAIERVERLNLQPFDVQGRYGPDHLLIDIAILVRDVAIPADAGALKTEVDTALNIMKAVMAERLDRLTWADDNATRRIAQALNDYLFQLKGIAEAGLMTPEASRVAFARADLVRLKSLFVLREAGQVKNAYVARLWWASMLTALVLFGVYYGARTHVAEQWPQTQAWAGTIYDFRNFALMAAGTAIGTWLSFSLRRQELAFEDLAVLEPDRLNPLFRVVYMIGLASLVGLLLFSGAVIAGVGEVKGLEAMHLKGSWALLLGLLAGVAERALGSAVARSGTGFAASIGGGAAERVRV